MRSQECARTDVGRARPATWAAVTYEQEAELAHERRGTPVKAFRANLCIVPVELSSQEDEGELVKHKNRRLTMAWPKNIECVKGYKESFGQVQCVDKLLVVLKKRKAQRDLCREPCDLERSSGQNMSGLILKRFHCFLNTLDHLSLVIDYIKCEKYSDRNNGTHANLQPDVD